MNWRSGTQPTPMVTALLSSSGYMHYVKPTEISTTHSMHTQHIHFYTVLFSTIDTLIHKHTHTDTGTHSRAHLCAGHTSSERGRLWRQLLTQAIGHAFKWSSCLVHPLSTECSLQHCIFSNHSNNNG